jgi:perosamine synthetase
MSAALGISQLRRLEQFVSDREKVASSYTQRIQGLKYVEPPVVRPDVRKSWFVYVVKLNHGINRDAVIQCMAENGIPSRAYFSPIHLQPYILERFPDHSSSLPVTMDVSRRTLALPFHNQLKESEIDRVVQALEEALERSKLWP